MLVFLCLIHCLCCVALRLVFVFVSCLLFVLFVVVCVFVSLFVWFALFILVLLFARLSFALLCDCVSVRCWLLIARLYDHICSFLRLVDARVFVYVLFIGVVIVVVCVCVVRPCL